MARSEAERLLIDPRLYLRINWYLNGALKQVIPAGNSGTIVQLHSWWGNHGLKVDLNNDGTFDYSNSDTGYSPCTTASGCVDYATRNFPFSNGFSLQDFNQWMPYWQDPTHGKVKCFDSSCKYKPYGAGATFKINTTLFKCAANVWVHNGKKVLDKAGKEIYCQQVNTCGDGNVEGTETCDDMNRVNGDGCDSTCLKEKP